MYQDIVVFQRLGCDNMAEVSGQGERRSTSAKGGTTIEQRYAHCGNRQPIKWIRIVWASITSRLGLAFGLSLAY